jgi:hypothetical protein
MSMSADTSVTITILAITIWASDFSDQKDIVRRVSRFLDLNIRERNRPDARDFGRESQVVVMP